MERIRFSALSAFPFLYNSSIPQLQFLSALRLCMHEIQDTEHGEKAMIPIAVDEEAIDCHSLQPIWQTSWKCQRRSWCWGKQFEPNRTIYLPSGVHLEENMKIQFDYPTIPDNLSN